MTPAELRTYVYNNTLLESAAANDTIINGYLEQGYFDLCVAAEWPWMLATTADMQFDGTTKQSVALPSDFFTAISLYEPDRTLQLKPVSPSTAIAEYAGAGATGTPVVYYIAAGEITVKPIPDATYDLKLDYYEFTAVDFTQTTAPPFEPAFHRALAEFAIAKVWEREEDYERAQINFSLFRDTVSRMWDFYSNRGNSTPLIFGQDKRQTAKLIPAHVNLPFGQDGMI